MVIPVKGCLLLEVPERLHEAGTHMLMKIIVTKIRLIVPFVCLLCHWWWVWGVEEQINLKCIHFSVNLGNLKMLILYVYWAIDLEVEMLNSSLINLSISV